MPLLTVIVPAYNCAGYIDECLGSVLEQLPADCELIVVDDGSTDGTANALAPYEAQDNVKVLYRGHGGASAARNAGLEAASGRYIAFIDCDDTMKPGFIAASRSLMEQDFDLCIFGIERVPLQGESELWTVEDASYPSTSAFADAYIRIRSLMVYSNCNKFYRKSIIDKLGLRFDEKVDFGEDRLFNYAFIRECGRIRTSSLIMLTYLQRSANSLSSRHVERYFERVLGLHEAKMECFLGLSRDATDEEKAEFRARDLAHEVQMTIDRFAAHPEERAENMPLIDTLNGSRERPADRLPGEGG
ncbi:MAG TPA: hypothetical protein DCP91_00150 [Eggerthellaceae bacterium]|nr:hypothetical protein [Eggerthellaceae bacterium]